MWYVLLFLSVTLIGLTSIVAGLILWRRPSGDSPGRIEPRQVLGTLCLLAAGAGLVAGGQFKLIQWDFLLDRYPHELLLRPGILGPLLALKTEVFLGGCLALLTLGAALSAAGGPSGGRRSLSSTIGPFAWALAPALVLTLAELGVLQRHRYERMKGIYEQARVESIPSRKLVATEGRALKPPTHRFPSYRKKYHFRKGTEHFFGQHIPSWNAALEGFKGKDGLRYLEVGIFEGQSLLWMLENVLTSPTARATAIDPFSDPLYSYKGSRDCSYRDVFYANLKKSGFKDKVRIIEGYSQIELRKLPLESFDIIYVDGSHNSEDVLEDAILSWRLLKDGGVLIFDDYLLHAGMERTIDTFYHFFSQRFDPLHVDWQVFLRKRPEEVSSAGPWR